MYACRADDKMPSEYSLEGVRDAVFGAGASDLGGGGLVSGESFFDGWVETG